MAESAPTTTMPANAKHAETSGDDAFLLQCCARWHAARSRARAAWDEQALISIFGTLADSPESMKARDRAIAARDEAMRDLELIESLVPITGLGAQRLLIVAEEIVRYRARPETEEHYFAKGDVALIISNVANALAGSGDSKLTG